MRDPRIAKLVFSVLAVAVIAVPLFIACSDSSGSSESGTGTVNVRLTDAPIDIDTVQSVNVTITGVTLYPTGDDDDLPEVNPLGPVAILTHPDTFDLLTLTGGATTLLASGEAPAGHYQRIRLHVSEAELVFKDGTIEPLKLESNKVDVPIPFDLGVDETETMTLDFDAAASVQVNETGSDKYILRPVVTPAR